MEVVKRVASFYPAVSSKEKRTSGLFVYSSGMWEKQKAIYELRIETYSTLPRATLFEC